MKKSIILFSLFFALGSSCMAQTDQIFDGEKLLTECRVDLPLTFKKKDKPTYEKTAKELKGVLLSRIHYDRSTGKITYSNFYVVVDGEFVYLIEPDDFENNQGLNKAIFSPFKEKENRFYRASCFETAIENNESLKAKIFKKE